MFFSVIHNICILIDNCFGDRDWICVAVWGGRTLFETVAKSRLKQSTHIPEHRHSLPVAFSHVLQRWLLTELLFVVILCDLLFCVFLCIFELGGISVNSSHTIVNKWWLVVVLSVQTSIYDDSNLFHCEWRVLWSGVVMVQWNFSGYNLSDTSHTTHNITQLHPLHLMITPTHSPATIITIIQWFSSLALWELAYLEQIDDYFGENNNFMVFYKL